jgi:hypothetical protein
MEKDYKEFKQKEELKKREDEFVHVAMYSYEELISSFAQQFHEEEDPEESAMEWVDFNVMGAYLGKNTPFIVYN